RLLVAGHPGGEDDLTHRAAGCGVGAASQDVAVLEDEQGVVSAGTHRSPSVCWVTGRPSSTVARPRRKVATTCPGRVRPWNGVLLLAVTCRAPSTSSRAVGS